MKNNRWSFSSCWKRRINLLRTFSLLSVINFVLIFEEFLLSLNNLQVLECSRRNPCSQHLTKFNQSPTNSKIITNNVGVITEHSLVPQKFKKLGEGLFQN